MRVLFFTIAVLSAAAHAETASIDKSLMNLKVQPCDDFYEYACGKWIEKTEIPSDKPSWTRAFDEVNLRNQNLLRDILTGYSKGKYEPDVAYAKEMGEIYGSCMNEDYVEKNARKEFKAEVAPILAVDSVSKLAPIVADLHLKGADVLFSFSSNPDPKNSDSMIGDADQGGMGLPTKNYYLKDTPDNLKLREAYRSFVTSALRISGWSGADAKKKAGAVIAFETKLAKGSLLPEDHRDPSKLYHRLDRRGLKKADPKFDWTAYFTALGTPKLEAVNVDVPGFFKTLDKALTDTPLDDIKAYLVAHAFMAYAPAMDKESVNVEFKYNQTAKGMKELPPRWKRCVDMTGSLMSMAVGHAFVAKTFGTEGKRVASELMRKIEQAMKATLETVPWMDKPTRAAALAKLKTADDSMGYPDKWRNYDSLKTDKNSYFKNLLAGSVFDSKYELEKIGKPVDRSEWSMPPHIVNAENLPQFNQMRFPAGILQPPNFEAHRSLAANYGAIGMVMGHELTHSYDDQGRQFNQKGDLKDWWSKSTAKEFEHRAKCLANQFSSYTIDEGVHGNGKLTLGEVIADQGGVKLAVAAWKTTDQAKSTEKIEGFTPLQVLFISYAQMWCSKNTPQFRKLMTNTNPHPLPKFRVIGTLSDSQNFASAFSCKADDKMVAKPRCEVW